VEGPSLGGSAEAVPSLDRELMFGAKPRAGRQTSSGSAVGLSRAKYARNVVVGGSGEQMQDVPSLHLELMFGAKPRAGRQTSSGSAVGLSRAKCAWHGVVEGAGEQKHSIYCVLARLKAQSQTSCGAPNLKREVEGSGEQKHGIYCVFASLKAQSSKVGLLIYSFIQFSNQIASPTYFLIWDCRDHSEWVVLCIKHNSKEMSNRCGPGNPKSNC